MLVCRAVHLCVLFFFSSRRRHTRLQGDWSSDVCSSDLCVSNPPVRGAKDGAIFQAKHAQTFVLLWALVRKSLLPYWTRVAPHVAAKQKCSQCVGSGTKPQLFLSTCHQLEVFPE